MVGFLRIRDHPDVGPILSELFMANFEQDYNPELFSPGVRGTVEAYDELLYFYEQPTTNTLLEWLRESAEQVGVRVAPGRLSRPRAGPAAPGVAGGRDRPARAGRIPPGHSEAETVLPGSGGQQRPEEPAVLSGGAGVRAESRAPTHAAGPGEFRDADGPSGRSAFALGEAQGRDPGPENFINPKFLSGGDPWSKDDPWRAGAEGRSHASRATAPGKQSGSGARGPHVGKERQSGNQRGPVASSRSAGG